MEDTHDPRLGGGVGGRLGHLPLGIHLRPVEGEPQYADQEKTHGNNHQDDGLTGSRSKRFRRMFRKRQNRITPCATLTSRSVPGKYVIKGS